jgi:glycosyltransferase involved in cell wall biosynthesis
MKILQVNCVYAKGSTGKIVQDIHRELQKHGVESIVCYGRGKTIHEPGVYKVCGELYSKLNNLLSRITGIMYGGCFFSTNKLIRIIRKEQPDVVHLQCINGYFVNIYRLVNWLKKHHIKTLLTLHAEFMYTANCGHALECEKWKTGCGECPRRYQETKSWLLDGTARSWAKMKKAFDGFNDLTVISVSPWLMDRAKQSPMLADKEHCVVLNGINTNVFKPHCTQELRNRYGLTDEKVILHVTPVFSDCPDHLKGGYYIIQLAKMMPGVRFFVAGDYIQDLKVPENVTLLGMVANQEALAKFYSMADVTVLASKKETFSMVTAESLCCGTPVVGFQAGAPEQIAMQEYSEFVEYGKINLMADAVQKMLDRQICCDIAIKAKKKYSSESMVEGYYALYLKAGE